MRDGAPVPVIMDMNVRRLRSLCDLAVRFLRFTRHAARDVEGAALQCLPSLIFCQIVIAL